MLLNFSYCSILISLVSHLLIQQLLISRICLKAQHEKGQPLQSICRCIKTWKLSMKTRQSAWRCINGLNNHLYYVTYTRDAHFYIKKEWKRWKGNLISCLNMCDGASHGHTSPIGMAWKLQCFQHFVLLLLATHRNKKGDEILRKWMNNYGLHQAENH